MEIVLKAKPANCPVCIIDEQTCIKRMEMDEHSSNPLLTFLSLVPPTATICG